MVVDAYVGGDFSKTNSEEKLYYPYGGLRLK